MASKNVGKNKVSKLEDKQRQQARLVDRLRRTNRWILWLGAIIIFFLLLGMLLMGYASNWWQDPETADRTSSFAADSGSNQDGLSGTGSDTSTSTSRSTESAGETSTSTTTTTTNNTTNNTTTPSDANKSLIEQLLAEIEVGDDIDEIRARATQLGIDVDCNNTLVAVQECTFTAGDYNITTKNLITNDGITGLLNNLNDLGN